MSSKNEEIVTENEELITIKDELTIEETQVETELFVNGSNQFEVQQQHYQLLNLNEDNNEPYIILSKDENSEMPSAILPDLPLDYDRTVQINQNEIYQSNVSNVKDIIQDKINLNDSNLKSIIQVKVDKSNESVYNLNESNGKSVYQYFHFNTPVKIVGLHTTPPILYVNQEENSSSIATSKKITNPPPDQYKCGLCNLKFDKAVDRNNHIVSHTIAATYKCKSCQKDFPYVTALLNHLFGNICYKQLPVQCFHCRHTLTTLDRLQSHHQLEMKKCKWCNLKICGKEIYEAHLTICRFKPMDIRKTQPPEIIDLTVSERNVKRIKKAK
ncbi:putative zinc finger protein 876 [Onthophagus taurus]|uniref:putative zinc finger protein 876 n=1 Tax=Onthophagus taurus TaxID=166361 RepID=UPI0039BDE7E0